MHLSHRRQQRLRTQLRPVRSAASCAEWTLRLHREGESSTAVRVQVLASAIRHSLAGHDITGLSAFWRMHPGATMRGMSSRGLALGPALAGSRPCGCTATVQRRRRKALHTPGECEGPKPWYPPNCNCTLTPPDCCCTLTDPLSSPSRRKGDTLDEIMFGKK
jgi:hypothetical protein